MILVLAPFASSSSICSLYSSQYLATVFLLMCSIFATFLLECPASLSLIIACLSINFTTPKVLQYKFIYQRLYWKVDHFSINILPINGPFLDYHKQRKRFPLLHSCRGYAHPP